MVANHGTFPLSKDQKAEYTLQISHWVPFVLKIDLCYRNACWYVSKVFKSVKSEENCVHKVPLCTKNSLYTAACAVVCSANSASDWKPHPQQFHLVWKAVNLKNGNQYLHQPERRLHCFSPAVPNPNLFPTQSISTHWGTGREELHSKYVETRSKYRLAVNNVRESRWNLLVIVNQVLSVYRASGRFSLRIIR